METEPEKPKTRTETRKVEVAHKLNFETVMDELDATQVANFKKFEKGMQATEEAVTAALNAKNDLETFVYVVRDKIDGAWKSHGTAQEFKTLEGLCDDISGWLYGEGDDVSKGEYDQKKAPLQQLADKLSKRQAEWNAVPAALADLEAVVNGLRAEVTGGDEKYSHIAAEEMEKALANVDEAQKVLNEAKAKWASTTPQQDPPVASLDLKMRKDVCTSA
jgi:heat shock protein 4